MLYFLQTEERCSVRELPDSQRYDESLLQEEWPSCGMTYRFWIG